MASRYDYDVAVIGAGPGGYVAAIRASQLGLRTAIIEREEQLGGVCLNWGCIPSKALLRNAEVVSLIKRAADFGISFDNLTLDYSKAVARSRSVVARLTRGVSGLLRKNAIERIHGEARFIDPHSLKISVTGEIIRANNVIIATGAKPRSIPSIDIDHCLVDTSRQAIDRKETPSSVVIVGGGAIGVEFASIFHAYGVNVTIVELLPNLLPSEDKEISLQLERSFSRQGINFMTNAMVMGMTDNGHTAVVQVRSGDSDKEIECQRVLVAVGVEANSESLGLEEVGIATEKGFIRIDENMETTVSGVYAIGDVTGKLLLAHAATAQGVHAVEFICGKSPLPLSYLNMPKATYSSPQVASFGLTEAQAVEQGYNVKIGKFPFQASGKALAMGESQGMVKLVTDAQYGELLGAHLIGSDVTEILAELSMARMLEGTVTEMGWMVHSHPTLSEAVKEAALAAKGEAVHI